MMTPLQIVECAGLAILGVFGHELLLRRKAKEEQGLTPVFDYRLEPGRLNGRVTFYESLVVRSNFLQQVFSYEKIKSVKCRGTFIHEIVIQYVDGQHGLISSMSIIENNSKQREQLLVFLRQKCPAASV